MHDYDFWEGTSLWRLTDSPKLKDIRFVYLGENVRNALKLLEHSESFRISLSATSYHSAEAQEPNTDAHLARLEAAYLSSGKKPASSDSQVHAWLKRFADILTRFAGIATFAAGFSSAKAGFRVLGRGREPCDRPESPVSDLNFPVRPLQLQYAEMLWWNICPVMPENVSDRTFLMIRRK